MLLAIAGSSFSGAAATETETSLNQPTGDITLGLVDVRSAGPAGSWLARARFEYEVFS
jgi:hypothetical protein